MTANSSQQSNCCPKEIAYKEVRLWATAYLRYQEKRKSQRISGKFEDDIRRYKRIVTKYVDEFNKKYEVTLRVAFIREILQFPGDPYVKLAIYLEYAEPERFYSSQRLSEAGYDEMMAERPGTLSTRSDEAVSMQGNEPLDLESDDIAGAGADDVMGSESDEARDVQADDAMSLQANAIAMGTGPITPPQCPPDRPNLAVSEVAYTECAFQ